ncbi:MAG: peroxiredoxin family protein, partial [Pyrinomonadaceae bacterium]
YLKSKATVVGISPGSVQELRQFSKHHKLPLTLLSDSDRQVAKFYNRCWLPAPLTRAVVVLDARGLIRSHEKMFRAFRPSDQKILALIEQAKKEMIFRNFLHG